MHRIKKLFDMGAYGNNHASNLLHITQINDEDCIMTLDKRDIISMSSYRWIEFIKKVEIWVSRKYEI